MTFLSSKILKKYGSEGFEDVNNFLHRNFFRTRMDFKLKI
jgi:hypothetical protein